VMITVCGGLLGVGVVVAGLVAGGIGEGFVRREVDSRINRRIGQRLVPVSIASLIFSFARRIRHWRGTSKVRQCVYGQYVRLLFYPYAPCCLPKSA
jgi:hypothetical protein